MPKRWSDLSPRTRKILLVAGAVEAALKVFMLADLRGRDPSQVRGSKKLWAISAVVNSMGIVPVSYFLFGRRR